MREAIDFGAIKSPVFLGGNSETAFRDPAAHYHEGVFRVFFTQVKWEDGYMYLYLGVTESQDLINWSTPHTLTPRDLHLNFSSPGNVVRFNGKWLLCLQTYPMPERGQAHGNEDARIWTMESTDLKSWGEPKLIKVKGDYVPQEVMGRMIDPYLLQDKDEPERWWCFYKQNGMSMSYSYDLEHWEYFGRTDAGENACVLTDFETNEYILFHSPKNGIGVKRSSDLVNWEDHGLLTLAQDDWPWAQGRLTAGQVLDLRSEDNVGKYIMFFHGSKKNVIPETHGAASLAIAWSDDLINWEWAG